MESREDCLREATECDRLADLADLPKPNTRIRRYLIEVKDPQGKSVFLTAAHWDEEDKRVAIAQIMRLADIPVVNS